MTDKPIIFSAPMIRALLDGRKTQTRRVLKPQPSARPELHQPMSDEDAYWAVFDGDEIAHRVRVPYAPGDRLWVREAFYRCEECAYLNHAEGANSAGIRDRKCCANCDELLPRAKSSPVHMPRWASRLTLTVTDVRVQRVQEISEADAKSEGSFLGRCKCMPPQKSGDAINRMFRQTWCKYCGQEFSDLWNSIHGPGAWDANPWVAVISFTVERRNIDAVAT